MVTTAVAVAFTLEVLALTGANVRKVAQKRNTPTVKAAEKSMKRER